MSKFDDFLSESREDRDPEPDRVAINVNFLCGTCNEPVTTAYIIPGDKSMTEWTCSKGHTSSMKWRP